MMTARFTAMLAAAMAGLALLPLPPAARAEVVFQFTFADVQTNAAHGFNDPIIYPDGSGRTYGEVRRENTAAAARRLGMMFRHAATVTVYVTSSQIPGDLGACGSEPSGGQEPGFVRSIMAKKIIEGVDANGGQPDAELVINFIDAADPEWGYDDDIPDDKYDYQDTLIHELTHALGYLNAIGPGGGGMLEDQPAFAPQKWYAWDGFLTDAATNRLVNGATFEFDAARLPTLTNGAMFFYGPNSRQGNNGRLVPIYAPSPWSEGSSASHIDTNYPPIATMFWVGSQGRGCRGYMPAEAGIMADLGYDIMDVSAPGKLAASTNLPDKVALSWEAPPFSPALSGVVGYAVYRGATTAAAAAVKLADLAPDVLAYDDSAAAGNTRYYYWVRAQYGGAAPQTSLMQRPAAGYWGGLAPDEDPELGPAIRANGRRGIVQVAYPDPVAVTVALKAGQYAGVPADWWALAVPSYGNEWYCLQPAMQWNAFPAGSLAECRWAVQADLQDVAGPVAILPAMTLPVGTYYFYFAVDQMDGVLNYPAGPLLYDMVQVEVE